MAKSKFSIEEAFEELENIVRELEGSELNLSDSMNLYKKGVRLLDKCNQALDKTEKEIIVLQEGQNGTILKREDSE